MPLLCAKQSRQVWGLHAAVNWESLSSLLATEESILPGTPVWKTSKASGVAQS